MGMMKQCFCPNHSKRILIEKSFRRSDFFFVTFFIAKKVTKTNHDTFFPEKSIQKPRRTKNSLWVPHFLKYSFCPWRVRSLLVCFLLFRTQKAGIESVKQFCATVYYLIRNEWFGSWDLRFGFFYLDLGI
jgi:hypothetical protein